MTEAPQTTLDDIMRMTEEAAVRDWCARQGCDRETTEAMLRFWRSGRRPVRVVVR